MQSKIVGMKKLFNNIDGKWYCKELSDAIGNRRNDCIDFTTMLITANANPNMKTNKYVTPLHKAVLEKDFEMMKFLVEKGASLFIRDEKEKTPLKCAQDHISGGRQSKFIEYLVSQMDSSHESIDANHCATLNETSESQSQPDLQEQRAFREFISYCINGNASKINEAKHGSFIENNDFDVKTGFRAIDFAAHMGHKEVVIRLLELGANVEVRSERDDMRILQSAYDIAISRDHKDVVECFSFKNWIPKRLIESAECESEPSTSKKRSINDLTAQEAQNLDEIIMIVQPMVNSFTVKGTISFSGKMTYLHAIHAILLKDSKACQVVATKEFIDEIATIVGDIISKDNNSHQKDFEVIAKILVKLNLIDQGKDLIDSMKMSFGAFNQLKTEMKKYESTFDTSQFVFESDSSKRIKTEVTIVE